MTPYIGEIRMFGGNYAPEGWAFCQGQTLPISEFDTLFNLIGTIYGGDGQETFNLPNLGGRIPLGSDYAGAWPFGQMAGEESVTLTTQQIPVHDHVALATVNQASAAMPGGAVPASLTSAGTVSAYGTRPPTGPLDMTTVTPVGGSQPHNNLQPFTVVSFIISLFGIYPSPS
jgi:microcystin-dependent protein